MKTNKHSADNNELDKDLKVENTELKTENDEVELTEGKKEEEVNSDELSDKIAEEIEELKLKCDELNDKNLRLMAEFDNYRKRTLKEKAELIKTASERVFIDMLPLVDDFDRALQSIKESEDVNAVKEGIELIYNKFIAFLNAHGVKEIPTKNEPFNVDLHEAFTTIPTDDEAMKGKIIDCISKGYMLNDKVIRYSKVVVGE